MARAGVFSAVGLAVAAVLAAAPAAFAETVTFGPNSALEPFHRWTVPARVCSATFDLYGAEGGGATDVRTGPTLAERILVAGGGGGNGGRHPSGVGGLGGSGGLVGADGTSDTSALYEA